MKNTSMLGWVLIMGLVLFWTNLKQKEIQRELAEKQARADSLALDSAHTRKTSPAPQHGQPSADARIGQTGDSSLEPDSLPAESEDAGSAPEPARVLPPRTIKVETNHYVFHLTNQGARLQAMYLKELDGQVPPNPELMSPESEGALSLTLGDIDLDDYVWETTAQLDSFHISKAPLTVYFTLQIPGLPLIERSYTFYHDLEHIHHELRAVGYEGKFAMAWNGGLEETEEVNIGKGLGLTSTFFSEVIFHTGTTVFRKTVKEKEVYNEDAGVIKWVGLRRKYMAGVMDFHRETYYKVTAKAIETPGQSSEVPKTYELTLEGSFQEPNALDFDFVIIPLKYSKLKAYGEDFEKILFSGYEWALRADVWYVKLCGLILTLLNHFYNWVPNYGVAIILLTLLVRVVTFPLTIHQTKSSAKMVQHMPAIKQIRDKYKSNPQKMNTEIMAYYKQAGVNPFGGAMGCLTAFVQMPIFISLFHVLGRAVELRNADFMLWISDLSRPDVIWPALKIPYIFPLGLTILPFFMAISMYYLMKLTIRDPSQKAMIWVMPIMMFIFSCSFPSGLVLYWTISNLFTIAHTYFYTSKLQAHPPPIATGIGAGPVARPGSLQQKKKPRRR